MSTGAGAVIKPNFLFIGASKAGSSWIYEILREHPEVFVPDAKDVQFFDYYYDKGFDWYYGHFREARGYRAVGELSHDYFLREECAERIHAALPDARLMCCLREPVDKTVSTYIYDQTTKVDRATSLAAYAARPEVRRLAEYHRNLAPFFARFPRDRILVLFFDELRAAPAAFVQRIFRFLEVDPMFVPSKLHQVVLAARKPRSFWLAHMAYRVGLALRQLGLANVVGRVKRSTLVERMLYRPLASRPQVDPETRAALHAHFAPELDRLEALLGQPVPAAWRRRVDVGAA